MGKVGGLGNSNSMICGSGITDSAAGQSPPCIWTQYFFNIANVAFTLWPPHAIAVLEVPKPRDSSYDFS